VSGISKLSIVGLERIVGLMCRSIKFRQDDQIAEALACLAEAIRINPFFLPCWVSRAFMLAGLERYEEAIADLNHYPGPSAELSRVRSDILHTALAHFGQWLDAEPGNGKLYFQRGNLLLTAHEFIMALADYDRALQLVPDHSAVLNNRGIALQKLNRYSEALADYEIFLDACPQDAIAWFNRGNIFQLLNRLTDALDSYTHAVALKPGFAEALTEAGRCSLALGDFQSGWRLHEWRWETAPLKDRCLDSERPLWLGESELGQRTILIWAEQGFGDTLQFARFVPKVADRAGKVILRAPKALRALLLSVDGRVTVIDDSVALPAHDVHCPLMSLPLALGSHCDFIPAAIPYLRADAALSQRWRDFLGKRRRPRIGLAWAGRQHITFDASRDMDLETIASLAQFDMEFLLLQKTLTDSERQLLEQQPEFRFLGQMLTDFAETAALIENLDLVISVDTAVAHLAGALGKPCWLMLKHAGEWRWQTGRTDTPWYPSTRIFRQEVAGDWNGVVCAVIAALASSFWLGSRQGMAANR
jgi:tetratricopeptide (TPR) repeat protein